MFKILLLENENINSWIITENLRLTDMEIYSESKIDKINESFQKFNPDCLLINIDSYTLGFIKSIYKYIKSKDDFDKNKIPIILFSNCHTIDDDIENIYLDFCDDFILNPFKRVEVFKKRLKIQLQNFEYVKKIKELSTTDDLLQINNRRALDKNSTILFDFCRRNNSPMFFFMCDIDHFKQFNDKYGHAIGDKVLQTVAQTIKKNLKRESDNVYRFGGEEIVITGFTKGFNKESVYNFAEKIRKSVSNTKVQTEEFGDLNVTISIGIYYNIPKNNETILDIKEYADNLLYQAKENGRNCCIM